MSVINTRALEAYREQHRQKMLLKTGLNPPKHAPHDYEQIVDAIHSYYELYGDTPVEKSGDATRHLGYSSNWRAVSKWLGDQGYGSLATVCARLGYEIPKAHHTIEAIRIGISNYIDEHGKRPRAVSGDATKYVGYETTWNAIDHWLRKREYRSLSKAAQELGHEPRYVTHSLEAIVEGILKYYQETGRAPTRSEPGAEKYVGYETTWRNINQWLGDHGCGSLPHTCYELGIMPRQAKHSAKGVRRGCYAFREAHGKFPNAKSGDASEYVGYKATWKSIDGWLRRNGHGSLSKFRRTFTR